MKVTFDIDNLDECDDVISAIAKAHGWENVTEFVPESEIHMAHSRNGLLNEYSYTEMLDSIPEKEILEAADDIRPKIYSDVCETALTLSDWVRRAGSEDADRLMTYIRESRDADIRIRFG